MGLHRSTENGAAGLSLPTPPYGEKRIENLRDNAFACLAGPMAEQVHTFARPGTYEGKKRNDFSRTRACAREAKICVCINVLGPRRSVVGDLDSQDTRWKGERADARRRRLRCHAEGTAEAAGLCPGVDVCCAWTMAECRRPSFRAHGLRLGHRRLPPKLG